MKHQEINIKNLANYLFTKIPKDGWDFFEFNNGIDIPKPQSFTVLGEIVTQGLLNYGFEPKETVSFNKNDIYKNLNFMEIGKIIYIDNAPINSDGNEVWNTFRFKLYKDGSYEGQFFWDDTRILKVIELNIKTLPDRVIQELQFDIWEDEYWETAQVAVTIFEEKVSCIIDYFSNQEITHTKKLPLNENLYGFIKSVFIESNTGALKEKFEPWNKFTIKVFYENYYFKNKYVKYDLVG